MIPENTGINNRITALIRQNMKTYRITGASVSIVDGDKTVFSEGFGFADKANKIKVTGDTVFKIGSITKVFTASAVMQLAEQGKINIDRPVKDYIPDFSVKSRFRDIRQITVRDLLCHHSGLPCDDLRNYFSPDPGLSGSVIEFLADAYLVNPPGKMFYYSNLGFDLLGVIISKASGMSFHKYTEEVLLKGLNMNNSGIFLPDEVKKNISKPYNKGKEQVEGLMKYLPAGGIHSSASEMAKFMKSVINGGKGLFQDESNLNSMLMPQYPGNQLDFNMNNGLGWFIGKPGLDYAGKVIWHDGGTPNFFSLTVIIPEHRLGITLLTNSAGGALMNHRISVDILKLVLEAGNNIQPPSEQGKDPLKLTSKILNEKAGRFFTLSGIATVRKSGKKLVAHLHSGKFLLHRCRDDWFNLSLFIFGIIPLKLEQLSQLRIGIPVIDGEKIFVMEQLGFRMPVEKEFKTLNTSDHWKAMSGKYKCIGEDNPRLKSFRLCNSKNGMFISLSADKMGHLKLYLDVINDSEAITFGYGRYAGETIFATKNSIKIFGLEFRKQ